MRLYPFLITLTALSFVSCSISDSDSNLNNDSGESTIVGQWNWVQSTNGWTGRTFLPDEVGYTQRLYYFPDSTFSYFVADTLFHSGKYSLEERNGNVVISYEIAGKDLQPDQQVEFKTSDLIELVYLCIDCPTSIYERIH